MTLFVFQCKVHCCDCVFFYIPYLISRMFTVVYKLRSGEFDLVPRVSLLLAPWRKERERETLSSSRETLGTRLECICWSGRSWFNQFTKDRRMQISNEFWKFTCSVFIRNIPVEKYFDPTSQSVPAEKFPAL